MADFDQQEEIIDRSKRTYKIFNILKEIYTDARVLLNFTNRFELLIATILSAQCTDERVNKVTPNLFRKFSGPTELAKANIIEVENLIRPTGFYKNKAKTVINVSKSIVKKFNGNVPNNIEGLTSLSGVGRKTANVVLSSCFDIPAIIVDTHVRRVTQRLGLTKNNEADKIEQDLNQIIKDKDRTKFSHVIGFHGRLTCKARKPDCINCKVNHLCPSKEKSS